MLTSPMRFWRIWTEFSNYFYFESKCSHSKQIVFGAQVLRMENSCSRRLTMPIMIQYGTPYHKVRYVENTLKHKYYGYNTEGYLSDKTPKLSNQCTSKLTKKWNEMNKQRRLYDRENAKRLEIGLLNEYLATKGKTIVHQWKLFLIPRTVWRHLKGYILCGVVLMFRSFHKILPYNSLCLMSNQLKLRSSIFLWCS